MGFFLFILTIIESMKSRIKNARLRSEMKTAELKKKLGLEVDETGLEKKASKASNRTRVYILGFLSAVIMFFELLPIFLVLIFFLLVIILVIALVVMILSFLGMVKNFFGFDKPPEIPTPDNIDVSKVTAAWTEEELAVRGIKLTDFEKNIYRMGIVARKALEGYGGGELMAIEGAPFDLRMAFLVGVMSTETSMEFYENNAQHNIFEIPSDKALSKKGYGFMGISHTKKLGDYFSSEVVSRIKSEYSPKTIPPDFYDAAYVPWGVAMSAKHHTNDLKSQILKPKVRDLAYKIMDSYGIMNNREELFIYIAFFLAQAEYHGAIQEEYEAYINFFCALYAATSDNDEERSFSSWSVKGNYDEYSARLAILGGIDYRDVDNYATPDKLPKSTNPSKVTLYLNGVAIDEPLWAFLWNKYGHMEGFKLAWNQARTFGTYTTGVHDRVLNFHYGFNSYLQGTRVLQLVQSKLIGGASGNFKETPGKGQGIVDNKPTEDLVRAWLNANSENAKRESFMNTLKEQWGTSSYLSKSDNYARKVNYVDNQFGVPFYGQNTRTINFQETYGKLKWHWGSPSDWTFNRNGCMVFSVAYTLSALKGKLINPPETAAIMITKGALNHEGILMGEMYKVYNSMGLNSKYLESPLTVEGKNLIDKVLENGGLAVVRVTGSDCDGCTKKSAGLFTSSPNHFIVLTGVTERDGERLYSLYTSTDPQKSKQVYRWDTLEANMHKNALLVWEGEIEGL